MPKFQLDLWDMFADWIQDLGIVFKYPSERDLWWDMYLDLYLQEFC